MDKGIKIAKECNITYKTPGETCRSAMPIGNGELAASVWTNKVGNLEMYLSRSDALSEIDRTLKLGKICVELSPNPFIGKEFEQTLDLTDGSILVSGKGGYCRVFIGDTADSLFIRGKFTEKIQIQVTYETWRTEEFYFENEFSKEEIPESPDVVHKLAEGTYFYHKNQKNVIEETVKNQSLEEYRELVPDFLQNRIFGGIVECLKEAYADEIEVRIHTRSAQESEEEFRNNLLEECKKNYDSQQEYLRVKEKWHAFWAKSYIRVTGDEAKTAEVLPEIIACATEPSDFFCECESVVTRAYTLTKYMMACCSNGRFPMLYNGLLFQQEPAKGMHFSVKSFGESYTGQPGSLSLESNPDERSWSREQLWQNLRHLYFVLPAMGEVDKLKPLFDYFRNFQDINRARAKKYYQAKGQHNTEMTLSCGLQNTGIYGRDRTDRAIGWAENRWGGAVDISPGLELVSLMLDYYEYTQDSAFLEELLVYAKELLMYIETRFPNRQDSKMVIGPLQSIETYWNTINPITVVAGVHAIVHRILSMPESSVKEYKYFCEYQSKIPEIPLGKESEKWILKPAMAYAQERHNVEPPEYYTVFPFNLVGLGIIEKELVLHTFSVRTKECGLYKPFVLGSAPDVPSYCGWQYLGVVAAKLGLTDMCKEILTYNCSAHNPGYRFPAMWGPIYDAVPDADHGANILNLLQQMILQINGKEISVLSAFPVDWKVEYRLFVSKDTVIEGNEKGYEIKK